jgi:hypothetical protein
MINEFLKVVFKVDTKDFETNLKQASASMKNFGTRMESFGRDMSTKVTLPIIGIGTAMVTAASDAEETRSKFDTVFRDLASSTREWAETTATAVKRSSLDLESYLATLQDTFVPMGFARDEAAKLSQQMVQLGVDLGSFNNMADADVIRDLTSAMIGNHETVRKFGVLITEATLKQELLNMGLGDGVKEATNQQKALARLNIIMNSTTDAQGDAIRTSESFANQMKGLSATLRDLRVEFGNEIIPVLKESFIPALEDAMSRIRSMDEEAKRNTLQMGAFAAAIPLVTWALGSLIKNIVVISRALKGLFLFLSANPFVAVAASVATLGGAFYKEVRNVRKFREELENISDIELDKQFDKIANTTDKLTSAFGLYVADLSGANGIGAQFLATLAHITGQTDRYKEALKEIEKANFQAMLNDIQASLQTSSVIEAEQNLQRIAEILAMPGLDAFPGIEKRFLDVYNAAKAIYDAVLSLNNEIRSLPVTPRTEVGGGEGVSNQTDILNQKMQRFVNIGKQAKEASDGWADSLGKTSKAAIDLGQVVSQALTTSISTFGESLGKLIGGEGDMKDFFNSLLNVVLDFASQFGQLLIAAGIAASAFQQLLLNPFAAIAAGTALVGLTSLIRGLLSAGTGGTQTSVNDALITSSGDIIKFHPDDNILAMKDFSKLGGGMQEMVVRVEGQLRGEDIFISGTRGQVSYNR